MSIKLLTVLLGLSFLSTGLFADDEKQEMPGVPSQIVEHFLKSRGIHGMSQEEATAHLKKQSMVKGFAPNQAKKEVYTHCLTDSHGISMRSNSSLNDPKAKWDVTLTHSLRTGKPEEVKDADVLMSKTMLFEQVTKSTGGFVNRMMDVHVYAAKMNVKSQSTDLAMVLIGCIGKNVKEVTTTTMCYEVHPKPFN